MYAEYPINSIVDVENGQIQRVKTALPPIETGGNRLCPVCKKGRLMQSLRQIEQTIEESIYLIPMAYDVCTAESCGIVLFSSEQSKFNLNVKRELIALR